MELLDSTGSTVIATTTTNRNGNYYFSGLTVSDGGVTYQVRVAASNFNSGGVLEGMTNSYAAGAGTPVQYRRSSEPDHRRLLQSGPGLQLQGHGQRRKIGNLVWLDANKNGVFDSGSESPIGNVTIELYRDLNGTGQIDPGEPLMDTQTTNAACGSNDCSANGNYSFTGLPAGKYVVKVTDTNGALFGYIQTTGAAGREQ